MATNVQFVFYKDAKGTVLMKLLYNEQETLLENVPAYQGPYYRWEDAKAWFKSLYEN